MAQSAHTTPDPEKSLLTLFLCGDVMTGRGIDQILPHPGDPALHDCAVAYRSNMLLRERLNGWSMHRTAHTAR